MVPGAPFGELPCRRLAARDVACGVATQPLPPDLKRKSERETKAIEPQEEPINRQVACGGAECGVLVW